MDVQTQFEKYYRRLKRIGKVKAAITSLCCGLLFSALAGLVTWFTKLSLLWVLFISVGGGLLVAGVLYIILYYKVFAPSFKSAARAADKLGLDERAVTMFELEEDDSYLSDMQRKDAKAVLDETDERRIPIAISKILIALSCFAFVFAISMTTVSSLASVGRIARGYEYIFPPEEEEQNPEEEDKTEYVTVYYLAREHGTIEGEATQRIVKGANTKTVRAVAEEGYQFLQWSDGILTPERRDWEVMEDMAVEAIFLQPSEEDQGDRESEEGEQGKSPSDDENQQGSQENENGDPESDEQGEGEDEDAEGDEQDKEPEGDESGDEESGEGAAGADGTNDNNYVIDGQTDYKNEFDYEGSKEDVENDPEIPDDLKDLLSDYFDVLKP